MGTMRAVQFAYFQGQLSLVRLPIPEPEPDGVVIRVAATGVCRSDWHTWMGHDAQVPLPMVAGHELAGTITTVGKNVRDLSVGQRVTVPFACGCGTCEACWSGNAQVCPQQRQPGCTDQGAFAEYVAIPAADFNVVPLPDNVSMQAAALLGCRFATAARALLHRAELQAGEAVLVVGCGGVGLSAIMIAKAQGARVVALDVSPAALERAQSLGADEAILAQPGESPQQLLAAHSRIAGSVDVAVEAIGDQWALTVCAHALRWQGRIVQIGLFEQDPVAPIPAIIARELTLFGSHGMSAQDYPPLLELVSSGALQPEKLVTGTIQLAAVPDILPRLADFAGQVLVVEYP